MSHEVRDPGDRRGHDRDAACHRFDEHGRDPVPVAVLGDERRQGEHVGLPVGVHDLTAGASAFQRHAIPEVQLLEQGGEPAAFRPLTEDMAAEGAA